MVIMVMEIVVMVVMWVEPHPYHSVAMAYIILLCVHSMSFSSRLLDCFLVEAPPTSISFSPTGEFMATTHVDDLGIFLW